MNLNDIVVISAVRTAMGSFGGTLKDLPSYEIAAASIRESIKRAKISPNEIDEVILGNCRQAGNGPNPARTASVLGGIPVSVPVTTINMACPSGMKALISASQVIKCNQAKAIVVGGFESMSTIPYLLKNARWSGFKMGNRVLEDGWSDSIDPLISQGMGETAENLYDKYKIPRSEQDEYAISSHRKASIAQLNGYFDEEIAAIEFTDKGDKKLFQKDETMRHTTDLEKMAGLNPVFRQNGVVTAGNSCGLSDGSSALVVTSREFANRIGAKPLFSLLSFGQAAVAPEVMGEGPAYSIPIALNNAGMDLSNIDLIEVNEAFAIQVLANERILKWDRNKLNINGGAIALGHPTGTSGARIIVTLYHCLKRLDKTFGIAAICGGGGVTCSIIIQREL